MAKTQEVAGIKLKNFEAPIIDALKQYQNLTDGALEFELDSNDREHNAGVLGLTPERPNSARSTTKVKYLGKEIGSLYVIAFNEGDGTGDVLTYDIEDLKVAKGYPRADKVVPRSKEGTRQEAHLAVASQNIDD